MCTRVWNKLCNTKLYSLKLFEAIRWCTKYRVLYSVHTALYILCTRIQTVHTVHTVLYTFHTVLYLFLHVYHTLLSVVGFRVCTGFCFGFAYFWNLEVCRILEWPILACLSKLGDIISFHTNVISGRLELFFGRWSHWKPLIRYVFRISVT